MFNVESLGVLWKIIFSPFVIYLLAMVLCGEVSSENILLFSMGALRNNTIMIRKKLIRTFGCIRLYARMSLVGIKSRKSSIFRVLPRKRPDPRGRSLFVPPTSLSCDTYSSIAALYSKLKIILSPFLIYILAMVLCGEVSSENILRVGMI